MIISRTPFRMSFFGGGTDYPDWFDAHKGAVLATTFNKYCYITCRYLPPFFDHKSRIIYSQMEHINKIDDIDHPSVREVLRYMKIRQGIEIHHDGDLPARTGLGSSSSFTVGLLNALYALKGKMVTKEDLANEAIYVEQEMCQENVGCQDQALAAYGGFNVIEFGGAEHLQVQKVTISKEKLKNLQSHLLLYFTGFSRIASKVAAHQIKNIPKKTAELNRMYEMVFEARDILNDGNLKNFGTLLDESWKIKRSLSDKVSTPQIDNLYEKAKRAGAIGGKLLGAGGGGFALFFVPPSKQKTFKEKFKKLLQVPFKFESLGSQIIFYQPNGG
ncbi:D,D-heptose 7-phosphate kinase [hydrothermal vent metagenome]|uniref:D,D-heptose 7-phosphate kinase n=1 Tax=hydrothermal vent metagenome TaxID=652676 RepID=A0A3B1DPL0_9ZZZZ